MIITWAILFPKAHKSQLITDIIKKNHSEVGRPKETKDLKARPIVGRPKYTTRKLNESIDIRQKPSLKLIKNYIKDSVEFLDKCIRNIDKTNMYTNIPHGFALEALRYFLPKYKEDTNQRFNITFFAELIELMLKNNTCTIDN